MSMKCPLVHLRRMKSSQMLSPRRRPVTLLCATFLLTFTLINSGVAAPSDAAGGQVLKFELGKTYTYAYETSSVIKLLGTSDEESVVGLKGQVLLTPSNINDFVLTLGEFKLDVTSPNEKLATPVAALKGSSSRFTVEGGVIQAFYVNGGNSAWVANFHRAIASAFSNSALKDSQQAFYLENDVSGSNCPTEYKIKTDGSYHKKRDLNKCANRDGGYTEQYGVPFATDDDDEPQSDTSIRSSQDCVQKFSDGILRSGECTEVHRVTLLSSGKDTGGNAKVTAKLDFVNVAGKQDFGSLPSTLSTIFFDHAGTDLKASSDATEIIEGLLGKLCLSTGENGRLTSDTSSVFLTLKAKIRIASLQVLEKVMNKLQAGLICQAHEAKLKNLVKLYTDAVLMAGSTDSIAFGTQLVASGAVSENSAKRFRLYTAFANRPGDASLKSMLTLLDSVTSGKLSSRYVLTASGIAYQYCLAAKGNCASNPAYTALVNKIAEFAQANCGSAAGSEDGKAACDAVVGLQALGNINKLTPAAVSAIGTCLKQSDRLKIHALQAIRRDPCQDSVRAEARNVLKKQDNPAHVRVSAYLALSQCYDKDDSEAIRSFITTEDSIQVLSFLKSHRETAWAEDGDEAIIDSGLFKDVNFDKVKTDLRKFSSSFTFSDDMDDFAVNVIYSDDSFLPKILYSNTSAKLFGQEFGLIEVGAHLGGLEQDLMEKAFAENPEQFQEKTHRRPRRQAAGPTINQNEIDVFHSKVRVPERKTIPTDVYFRMFGTTVYSKSLTLQDISTKASRDAYMSELFDRVMKGEEISFTEVYPLYGDELIIPTVSGLSLVIQNEGAAIVSLKYSHTLSENFVTFSPKISPGISLANNMKLSIAGDIIEAGLRVETAASASTDLSLTGTLSASDDEYGYEVRLNMPPRDVKLVEASNDLYWILQTSHADYDHKQKMTTTSTPAVDTGVQCTKYLPLVTGLKGCFQAQLPKLSGKRIPDFPLSGPAKVEVTLSPPKGANVLVLKFTAYKPAAGGIFRPVTIEIDAPGAAENIKAVFKIGDGVVDGYETFSIDLESPKLKAGFSTSLAREIPGVHDLSYKAYVDDREYKLHLKRQYLNDTAADKRLTSYSIRYQLPKQPEVTVLSLDMAKSLDPSKISRQLAFKVNSPAPNAEDSKEVVSYAVSIDGTKGEAVGQTLNIQTKLTFLGKQVFEIKGSGKRLSQNTMFLDLDTTAAVLGTDEHFNVQGELNGIAGSQKLGFKGTGKSTTRAGLNADVEFDYTIPETNLIKTVLTVKSADVDVKIVRTIDKRNGFKISSDASAIIPSLKVNQQKKYDIEINSEKVAVNFKLASDGQTLADVKVDLNRVTKMYDVGVGASFAGKSYSLKSKNSNVGSKLVFEHSAEAEGKFKGDIKTEIYETTDADGVWKNRETTLTSDAFPDPYTLKIKYNLPKAVSVKVGRGATDMAVFSVSNKVNPDGTHNFMLDVSAEKVFVTSVGVKCNPKQELVEILGSLTAPPTAGVQRIVKLTVTGKSADDQPGERKFAIIFDLKLDGDSPQGLGAYGLTNKNRWFKAPGTFSLHSDNTIHGAGKTRLVNFKLDGQHQEINKLSLSVDHTSPEGKSDEIKISTEVDIMESKKFVSITFAGFGQGGTLETGIQNVNAKQSTGEFIAKYTCLTKGVIFDISGSSALKDGDVRAFGVSVGGFDAILPKGVKSDLTVETGPGKHGVNFLGKYGERAIYFNVNLEKTKGSTLKKFILDFDCDRNYRKEAGPALTTKTTLAYRYTSVSDFELESTGQYDLKGDGKFSHSFSRSVKVTPASINVDFSSIMQSGDKDPKKSEFKVNLENSDKKLVVIVDIEHKLFRLLSSDPSAAPRIDFDFETTKNVNDLDLVLSLAIPSDKFKTGSLNVRRTVAADGTRVGKVTGKLNQEKVELETNIFLTPAKKTADISLKLNDDTPKKLSLKYDNDGGHVAEATYSWGENGQVLKSKGSVTDGANDGFTAKFEFDVPAMKQQWNLEVSREVSDAKKGISFAAISTSSKQHIKFQVDQEKGQKLSYGGSLSVDLAAPNDKYDFDGTLKAIMDTSSSGKSVSLKLDYVVGEDKRSRSVSIDCDASPAEKNFDGKLCLSADNCFQLKSKVKTTELENKVEVSLVNAKEALDGFLEAGLTMSGDRKTRLTAFKYSLAHPSMKHKKELGINLYKRPGSGDDLELTKSAIASAPSKVTIRGVEIALAERTYAAHIAYAEWSDADAKSAELSLWFDKKTAPDQKLSIGYSLARASVQEEGQGKDFTFTVRHHKLQRDLKVSKKYRYGASSKVFESQTELDIFKRPEDKLAWKTVLTHDVTSETYALEHSFQSTGQGINLVTKCDGIVIDFPEFAANCISTRKVPNVADTNFKLQVKISDVEESFEIFNGAERMFYYKSVLDTVEGIDVHSSAPITQSATMDSELQIPGMTDLRKFNARWTRSPFRVALSTNPSSSKDVTNFWIGATSLHGGGWGFARTDESGNNKDMAAFSASVKAKKFHVHFDWNKDNIASYLAYAVKRGEEIQKLADKTCTNFLRQEWEVRKALRKSLQSSSQDFEPILQWYETQLTQITAKYGAKPIKFPRGSLLREEEAPPRSGFVAALTAANACLKDCQTSINNFLNSASTRPALPTPEAVKARARAVREFAEKAANYIRGALESTKALKEKYPFLKKMATKTREKVVAKIDAIVEATRDDLIEVYPYPEVTHFLDHMEDYFDVALLQPEQITQANRTDMLEDLEKAVEKVLSKTYSIDFAQGRIRAKVPLLTKLGVFQRRHGLQDIGKIESECIKEIIREPGAILPPVNGTAFIVGASTYVTFDGTVGTFDRGCQYLMASDFVHKNLSVVLDLNGAQNAEGLGSTLFVTDHKTTIGIRRGYDHLVINGKTTQIEEQSARAGAFIFYKEASFIIIEGDMGVTLGCTESFGFCAVQVSGFYHGKLQGIFGKFNNDPNDDWTIPTGQVSTTDGNFQKTWKLNQQCSKLPESYDGEGSRLDPLLKALKREELNYDNFFSRSSTSPHRAVFPAYAVFAGASSLSPISFLSLIITSLLSLLLLKFN